MPDESPSEVMVRAMDEGRWSVYGPFPLGHAEIFKDALEASGAFREVEIQRLNELCLICGWRWEQGCDLKYHRELEEQ